MEIGKKIRIEKRVEQSDTAAHYGSGLLSVFATPAMIALMENAAHQLSRTQLPAELDTVGSEVKIKHTRATPLGATVYAEATLIEVDGKKMVFEVIAFDAKGEIGKGEHTRYIIDPIKFLERIA